MNVSSRSPGLPVPFYCSSTSRDVLWAWLTFLHGPIFLTYGFSQGTSGRILLPWTQRWPFLKAQTLRPRSKMRNYLSNAKNQWQLSISMLCRVGLLRWQPLRNIWVLMKIWIFCNCGNGKMDWADLLILIISLRAETETKFWVRRAFSRKCYNISAVWRMEKPIPEEWKSLGSDYVLSAWNETSIKNGIGKDIEDTHHIYLLAYILYILDQLLILYDFSFLLFLTIIQGTWFILDFNP